MSGAHQVGQRKNPVKHWLAAPVAALVLLAALFLAWSPWSGDGGAPGTEPVSTGGTCYFSDAGTTATTAGGAERVCTYRDGAYTWQEKK